MMNSDVLKGSCLCGGVSYEIHGEINNFQYCHCSRCRKFTGSAHASNIFVPPEQFQWTSGEELLERYELPGAKHFATSFCKRCGSSLPWLTQSKKNLVVPAGTLDVDPGIRPLRNIFWASRASWYVDVCGLETFDALPIKK